MLEIGACGLLTPHRGQGRSHQSKPDSLPPVNENGGHGHPPCPPRARCGAAYSGCVPAGSTSPSSNFDSHSSVAGL
jgi:hypothetical protein